MINCPNCNTKNAGNAKFCYNCGHILSKEDNSGYIKQKLKSEREYNQQKSKETVESCAVIVGIICIIIGAVISFTGIGSTIGLPIALGGVYFISHAKEM